MLVYCKRCEAPNEDSASSCVGCGNPLKRSRPPADRSLARAAGRIVGFIAETVAVLVGLAMLALSADDLNSAGTRIVAAIYAVAGFWFVVHMSTRPKIK